MITERPRRLTGVPYVGFQRYFITTCTAFRRPLFKDRAVVADALEQILPVCTALEFSLIAYSFMPDHLHMPVIAQSERADLQRFVKQVKQMTGFAYRRKHGGRLWQPGYHDRVLRDGEVTLAVARYILENPVRAGLASPLAHHFK